MDGILYQQPRAHRFANSLKRNLADSELITQARTALAAWRDEETGLAKALDREFLDILLDRGYVKYEKDLGSAPDEHMAGGGSAGEPVFSSQPVSSPSSSAPALGPKGPQEQEHSSGQVLLMRVRTSRDTQVQFPLRTVRDSAFFRDLTEIQSSHDGEVHRLRPARHRGKINTLKVEIPEAANMTDPVLRLERTDGGIIYEVRDAASAHGRPIMDALRAGRTAGETFLTMPSDPDRSTWVRFV